MYCTDPAPWSSGRLLISRAASAAEERWIGGITSFLTERCVKVDRVHTGREAVSLVERGGVDAAILSEDLPRMDGLGVLRMVRSVDSSLPCVMLATDVSPRTLQQALTLGAFSVVTEPVDLSTLTRVTAGMFGRRAEWKLD